MTTADTTKQYQRFASVLTCWLVLTASASASDFGLTLTSGHINAAVPVTTRPATVVTLSNITRPATVATVPNIPNIDALSREANAIRNHVNSATSAVNKAINQASPQGIAKLESMVHSSRLAASKLSVHVEGQPANSDAKLPDVEPNGAVLDRMASGGSITVDLESLVGEQASGYIETGELKPVVPTAVIPDKATVSQPVVIGPGLADPGTD